MKKIFLFALILGSVSITGRAETCSSEKAIKKGYQEAIKAFTFSSPDESRPINNIIANHSVQRSAIPSKVLNLVLIIDSGDDQYILVSNVDKATCEIESIHISPATEVSTDGEEI